MRQVEYLEVTLDMDEVEKAVLTYLNSKGIDTKGASVTLYEISFMSGREAVVKIPKKSKNKK